MATTPQIPDVITPRLTLRLMDGEVMAKCLAGDLESASDRLGVRIPNAVLDRPSGLKWGLARLRADPDYLPWSARAIIVTSEQRMVGHVRFHSRPGPEDLCIYAPDAVEFGYFVFSDERGQGYATEAVAALIEWAKPNGAKAFAASIAPDNLPSLKLASRLGFVKVGEVIDEDDGPEHVYLLKASA